MSTFALPKILMKDSSIKLTRSLHCMQLQANAYFQIVLLNRDNLRCKDGQLYVVACNENCVLTALSRKHSIEIFRRRKQLEKDFFYMFAQTFYIILNEYTNLRDLHCSKLV